MACCGGIRVRLVCENGVWILTTTDLSNNLSTTSEFATDCPLDITDSTTIGECSGTIIIDDNPESPCCSSSSSSSSSESSSSSVSELSSSSVSGCVFDCDCCPNGAANTFSVFISGFSGGINNGCDSLNGYWDLVHNPGSCTWSYNSSIVQLLLTCIEGQDYWDLLVSDTIGPNSATYRGNLDCCTGGIFSLVSLTSCDAFPDTVIITANCECGDTISLSSSSETESNLPSSESSSLNRTHLLTNAAGWGAAPTATLPAGGES